ncbi:hypothetical protein ACU5AX_08880 [Sphingomonas sp. XXL09]|uniref:hypothetical protein n=1 Tax=Sphingomonas sp. XXL09 TaxID=3457787 RepID=UPI00406BC8CD
MTTRMRRLTMVLALGLAMPVAAIPAMPQSDPVTTAPRDDDIIVNGQRIRIDGGLWRFSSTRVLDTTRRGGSARAWARCIAAGDRTAVLMQLIDRLPVANASGASAEICGPLRFALTGARLRGRQSCMRSAGGLTPKVQTSVLRVRADLGDNAVSIRYDRKSEIAQRGIALAQDHGVEAIRIGDCALSPEGARTVALPAPPQSAAAPGQQLSPKSRAEAEIVREAAEAPSEQSNLPPLPVPKVEGDPNDIVVIARRLRLMRLHYASSGRILAWCHADVSSGDKRVDRIGCAMLRACVREGNETRDTALTCLRRKIDEVAADADDAARPRG